jgi:UDP-2-acetamido-3-amino-2,3-dideoxy-glucuronate N-acetyltransferase
MTTKINLGLIGGGYWGKNLIREFNNLNVLHTICDVNQQALDSYATQYPHIKLIKSFDLMLNDLDINAVCVSLPAEMHYEYSKKVLEAKKDLYVEKPITLNEIEALELVNLAKQNGCILMVGHLLHYHPAIIEIKSLISTGLIGNIKHIVSNRLNLGIFRTQENVLWSFAPHDISVILSLCGNKIPESVNCFGQANLTDGIHDITNTIFQIDDKYVNINVNWLNPYKEQKLTIIGDKGMILFDDMEQTDKLKLYENYVNWSSSLNSIPTPNKTDGKIIPLDLSKSPLFKECSHFVECCITRNNPITDGEEGLRVLTVLQMCSKELTKKKLTTKELTIKELTKKEYFLHESSLVDEGAKIGSKTKIWHWSHVTGSADIGNNCNIGQNCYIAGKLGSGCKVQNNVSLYLGVECEDDVFLGPSCVLTNDINPRCAQPKNGHYIKTFIEKGATIGANATIVCGTRIGTHALIGAGAVVTKNVEPYAIMVGNPAKKIGTIDEDGNRKLL